MILGEEYFVAQTPSLLHELLRTIAYLQQGANIIHGIYVPYHKLLSDVISQLFQVLFQLIWRVYI